MHRSLAPLIALAFVRPAAALPDLVVDRPTLEQAVSVDLQSFAPDACELQAADLCVAGAGARKLLKFSVLAVNQGDEDLVVGVANDTDTLPGGQPKWVFSACHDHYHFTTFARYELRRRGETTAVLTGQKRSFCVEDTKRAGATTDPLYCCNQNATSCPTPLQGVQVGWGDLYPSNLPCQWIDITDGSAPGQDLPPGDYDLCVFLNTAQVLPDADYTNDAECVPVTIEAPLKPAPKVKLRKPRARTVARVGERLKVSWKRRSKGELQFQEVWFSADDGGNWSLIASSDTPRNAYPWTVPADAVSETARIRVVVWTQNPKKASGAGAYQRGIADSDRFRVTP